MNRIEIIILSTLLSLGGMAQEALSFEQALQFALEYNHDIRMARLDEDIASNNARAGSNGYLPTLSATGNYTWSYNEGSFDLRDGSTNSFDPNSAYNYSAGASLDYTLFDGRNRHFSYQGQKLGKLSTEAQVGQLIEQTIVQLDQVYNAAMAAEEQEEILRETLDISRQRVARAEYGSEYGETTTLDVLTAQVDLDNDSINLLNASLQKEEAIRNLNLIMGKPIESSWNLADELMVSPDIPLDHALTQAQERNSQIKISALGLAQSQAALGASRGSWWPRLDANAQYSYSGSENPNGAFTVGQSTYGPSAGVSLSWSLFNGTVNNQIQNAKIQVDQQRIAQEATQMQVETYVRNAHARYLHALFVQQAQARNVETAQRNFDRSDEALKNGQLTSIEFRQAQVNLLNAQLQELQSQLDAKSAEVELLSLMGELVRR